MKPRRATRVVPLLGGVSEISSGLLERKKEGSLTPPRERGNKTFREAREATLARRRIYAAFDR